MCKKKKAHRIIACEQDFGFLAVFFPKQRACSQANRITAQMYEMNVPTKRKCADYLNHGIHSKVSWILTYRRIMKTRLE